MSTIRPLATIAVLAAVGVFLAYKINEGPSVAMNDGFPTADPGLIASSTQSSPAGAPSDAPAFDGADAAPAWSPTPSAPPGPTPPTPPALPALPPLGGATGGDLPPVEGQPAGSRLAAEPLAPPPGTTGEALTLPTEIPQAQYGGVSAAPPEPGVSGRVPSLGTQTGNLPSGLTPVERGAPASPFDAAWPAIEAQLAAGDLGEAHRQLSAWRDSPALSPAKRQEVDTLLSQLAGTVVWSMEHRLEPPHTVAPGETLESIAAVYGVPWQTIAKINGVPAANAVAPGQTLKVLRGPFAADVALGSGELVLKLGDRYAGRFPVRVAGVAPAEGVWRVSEKRGADGSLVLASPSGERVELGAGPAAGVRLAVASTDLAELRDILSVGSSVTVRR
ncbi:MAG: LysM domain-containing protein [Planctomycetota bacterium]